MRRVLAHRDFRLLWLSQVGSTVADRLVIVALALYVNDIGTPTDVGIVLAAQTIAFVALLLVGGVWADRLPRQKVMFASDIVRGGLHALLAVLIFAGGAEVWQIVVIEALYGAAHAFFRPAYTGLVPQTVPRELLQEANAVTYMTFNVASFIGPATAAGLILTVGAGAAFAIDAVTFLVSAALLLRIRTRESGDRPPREPVLRELVEGWREVRARPWVLLVVGSASLALMLALSPYQALGPAIAEDGYGEAAIFGVVGALWGAGTVLGSVAALRWRPRRPLLAAMAMTIPWTLNFVAFALGLPLLLLLPFSLLSGGGMALFMVWWETTLQSNIPPQSLGRVSSFDWMGSMGLAPLGYLLAGPVAAQIGAGETLIAGALIALVASVAVMAAPSVRNLRQPNSGTPLSGVEASA
ncbi:MAG TPA: MFS transporter [Solirubrobacteraceae bacterium]|nr:MFS transporter [Solirubrobacteraceae bacterium]